MKKLLIISFLLSTFACKNNTSIENAKSVDYEFAIPSSSETFFNTIDLVQQKLQEFYDLSALKQQHPEFEEELTKQIQLLTSSEVELANTSKAISITNVTQIGDIEILSDSISKLNLRYEVKFEKEKIIDSITAVIKTKKMTVDGKNLTSTKITFENIKTFK